MFNTDYPHPEVVAILTVILSAAWTPSIRLSKNSTGSIDGILRIISVWPVRQMLFNGSFWGWG